MYDYRIIPNTEDDLEAVWRLTYERYINEGYCEPQADGMLRHYRSIDLIPETVVLGAFDGNELVGTNSLTCDGPAGLHVDIAFPAEVKAIRDECLLTGILLGASWRIVTKKESAGQGDLVRGLINMSVDIGSTIADVTMYSFNPKHENCYRKMLGLETIARRDNDPSVNGAEAILMRGDMDVMLRTWNRFYRKRGA
jgi:hypothetical protein